MRFSAEVCQCQGTVQPEVNFPSMTAPPLVGSPRCAETVMQGGNPGSGANFDPAMVVTPALSCANAPNAIPATSPAVIVIFRNRFIVFSPQSLGTRVLLREL